MPYGFGSRGGWGFGFRGSSPPWPYVGRGRGGLPRCGYFLGAAGAYGSSAYWQAPSAGGAPMAPAATQEQELALLRSQARAVKAQLEQIEARMRELEAQANS